MSKAHFPKARKLALHQKIQTRDGDRCHYCGVELVIDKDRPTKGKLVEYYADDWSLIQYYSFPAHIKPAFIDHKHPRALGGTDELDNLVLSCRMCNSYKGAMPYEEYIALIRG